MRARLFRSSFRGPGAARPSVDPGKIRPLDVVVQPAEPEVIRDAGPRPLRKPQDAHRTTGLGVLDLDPDDERRIEMGYVFYYAEVVAEVNVKALVPSETESLTGFHRPPEEFGRSSHLINDFQKAGAVGLE